MSSCSTPPKPRIAIVGGGPAGLTLGLLLHRRHIPTTIFEFRPEPTEQDLAQPSGMLDLHEESGLTAIRECDLFDDFIPLTGECAEAMKISDKNGRILHEPEIQELNRPEISRHNLIKLLIRNLPTGTVKWNHKLLSAINRSTAAGHTETELDFDKHGKHTFDLVIGADGAWSRTRNLLTDLRPYYAGQHVITITIMHVTTKYPHLERLVGPGTFMALGDSHGIVSQRGPMDSARIYVFLKTADEHFATSSGLAGLSPTAAKDKLLSGDGMLSGWGGPAKELVTAACDEEASNHPDGKLDIRALYAQPDGNSWEHKAGVTLIGDAAHLMLPNGEGVNIAMLDAVLLSRHIIKAHQSQTAVGNENDVSPASFQDTFDPLLRAFEADEAARAREVADESRWLNDTMFSDGGAEALAKFFLSADG